MDKVPSFSRAHFVMTTRVGPHASQSDREGEERTSSDLGVELGDFTSVMDTTLMPTSCDDCPEVAGLSQRTAAANRDADRQREQQHHESTGVQTKDDRLASSCKSRRFRRSRTRASTTGSNKPTALVDAEMEMGLARGSRLAERAMHAVRQANAQVCQANLEV